MTLTLLLKNSDKKAANPSKCTTFKKLDQKV